MAFARFWARTSARFSRARIPRCFSLRRLSRNASGDSIEMIFERSLYDFLHRDAVFTAVTQTIT